MFGVADYGAFVVAVIVFLAIPGRQPGADHLHQQGVVVGGLAATLGVIAGDQVLMWWRWPAWPRCWRPRRCCYNGVQWLGAGLPGVAWAGR